MTKLIVAFRNFANAPKNPLMLFREIIVIYCESRMKDITELCGKTSERTSRVLVALDRHCFGTILALLRAARSSDWPNYHKLYCIAGKNPPPPRPYHFSIHLNQFSHGAYGNSTFRRNVGTLRTVQYRNLTKTIV
jgi:hypothetical protein